MTVNILGTEYTIHKKKYSEEPAFERRSIDGYCDYYAHNIAYCDMTTYPGWENECPDTVAVCEKQIIRHEVTHAFLYESGLGYSSTTPNCPWAEHEEMVDWIALQGPKLYKAWEEAGAL